MTRLFPAIRSKSGTRAMILDFTPLYVQNEGESRSCDTGYVALCPELDIASQGTSVSEARANLKEALDLFYEAASADEIRRRLHDEVYVTHVEVAVG